MRHGKKKACLSKYLRHLLMILKAFRTFSEILLSVYLCISKMFSILWVGLELKFQYEQLRHFRLAQFLDLLSKKQTLKYFSHKLTL